MKTTIKSLLIGSMFLGLLSFTVYKGGATFQEEYEDIGTIKQSILKPAQFNSTQKGVWEILKGQQIDRESELFRILEENSDLNVLTQREGNYFLPNALGTFIRSSNINGEGRDLVPNRIVGSLQEDEFEAHFHTTERPVAGHRSHGFPQAEDHDPGNWVGFMPVKTDSKGGSETRPVNISMYTYIKVAM